MLPETSVRLLVLPVDRIPLPPPRRRRGRPVLYPDRLFLRAVVIMIVWRLPKVHCLLATLDEPPRRWAACAGCSPRTGEVRRIFHRLRSLANENFHAHYKGIFNCQGQVPTHGLVATRRYVLRAVFVYQLVLLHRFGTGADLRVGLKPFLQTA